MFLLAEQGLQAWKEGKERALPGQGRKSGGPLRDYIMFNGGYKIKGACVKVFLLTLSCGRLSPACIPPCLTVNLSTNMMAVIPVEKDPRQENPGEAVFDNREKEKPGSQDADACLQLSQEKGGIDGRP